MARALGDESLHGDHEGRERGFHVRGAAAIETAVAQRGHEGVGMPFGERPRRHHVGVARQAYERLGAPASRPEILYAMEGQGLALESGARKAPGEDVLAAAVFGGDRPARDELPRELE